MPRIVRARVHPSSPRQWIEERDGMIEVWVRENAEGGRANAELIELLERHYGCSARIVKGFRKRTKVVELFF